MPIKEQQVMKSVPVFVGLDYHSKSVQVCVMESGGRLLTNQRCGNSLAEVVGAVHACGSPVRVAIEACCGAADLAEELSTQAGWDVVMAHPGYVARMKHNPDKTDFSDARMLADLCRVGLVPEVWLAPAPVRELRVLVRYRLDQVRRRTNLKLRILSVLREQRVALPAMGRWCKKWLAWLRSTTELSAAGRWVVEQHLAELDAAEARVLEAERQLGAATASDPIVTRLRELPGIGPVTAWTMRAIIGRFDRFRNGKQLARFCALTPKNCSSGERQADAGLIRAGDPALKGVLLQAAHRLRLHDPRWRGLYERLRDKGKPRCVAIAAVANRWVRGLHHEITEVKQAA